MTHYDILGVPETASAVEIKQAYRTLVKVYHPDINPSEEAKILIVQVTEAYEVLSDPYKRDAYDWKLKGLYVPPAEPVMSDYEIRRREYVRKKREQERRHWEHLLLMKVKFYKYQRYCAYPFLIISLIFTLDYFKTSAKKSYDLKEVKISPAGYAIGKAGPFTFETNPSFYFDALDNKEERVDIHYSYVFDKPVGVGLESGGYYQFHGTLHSFGNIFSYILFALSLVLIKHKEYNDFALTIGIIPFFIVAFLAAVAW